MNVGNLFTKDNMSKYSYEAICDISRLSVYTRDHNNKICPIDNSITIEDRIQQAINEAVKDSEERSQKHIELLKQELRICEGRNGELLGLKNKLQSQVEKLTTNPVQVVNNDEELKRYKRPYEEEKQIVNKVWTALGIETYEEGKGIPIWEHVKSLKYQFQAYREGYDKLKVDIKKLIE